MFLEYATKYQGICAVLDLREDGCGRGPAIRSIPGPVRKGVLGAKLVLSSKA